MRVYAKEAKRQDLKSCDFVGSIPTARTKLIMRKYANWQSGNTQNIVIVGSTPTFRTKY